MQFCWNLTALNKGIGFDLEFPILGRDGKAVMCVEC